MTDIRQALEEAWDKIHPLPELSDMVSRDEFLKAMEVSWPARLRFRRFLDAEAWTDAAMCLVPEGASFDLEKDHLRHGGQWHCMVGPEAEWHVTGRGVAETPAHALLAACLKAKEQADG